MIHLSLSEEEIAAAEFAADGELECGAEVRFLGIVRGTENGEAIAGIDYSAYVPMAQRKLEEIASDLQRKHGSHPVRLVHRLGFVPTGEPSVIVATGAKHSREAFALCEEYLRRVKEELPVWKRFVPVD